MDLLRRYVEGQQDSAERIREALKNKDVALAERIAHTVRGVSGNIGAAEVQAVAGELEESISKGSTESRTEEILKRYSHILEMTVARIRSALGEPSESRREGGPGKNVDPSVLREIVRKLTRYAEESDSEAFDIHGVNTRRARRGMSPGGFREAESILEIVRFLRGAGNSADSSLMRLSMGKEGRDGHEQEEDRSRN